MKYELETRYDSRKSFYGKAIVKEIYWDDDLSKKELYSYDTLVAQIERTNAEDTVTVWGTYSDTTLRHIKEFLKQNGFKAESKKQIEKDYMKGEDK